MNAAVTHNALVTCIIPVFNGAPYVGEALESVFQQTYKPIDILVVDDGSTDATPEVLHAYTDRVHVARQDNAGPAAARNHGWRLARGDLIAFLDADDLWHAEKIARQVEVLDTRPEVGAVVTYARNFWIDALSHEAAHLRQHRVAQALPGYLASTLLARRAAFEHVGEFNAELGYGHSTDWFLRANAMGIVVAEIPEVLYHRRLHHSNRSRQRAAQSRDEFFHLVKAHLDRQRRRDA
jgi:glycosyltransferase involved in cell wall biosynthesis